MDDSTSPAQEIPHSSTRIEETNSTERGNTSEEHAVTRTISRAEEGTALLTTPFNQKAIGEPPAYSEINNTQPPSNDQDANQTDKKPRFFSKLMALIIIFSIGLLIGYTIYKLFTPYIFGYLFLVLGTCLGLRGSKPKG